MNCQKQGMCGRLSDAAHGKLFEPGSEGSEGSDNACYQLPLSSKLPPSRQGATVARTLKSVPTPVISKS